MDDAIIIVRCMTLAAEPSTPVPSKVERCYNCDAEVWLSDETADYAAELRAKEGGTVELLLICEHCPPPSLPDVSFEAILPDDQIDRLRADGFSNQKIAHLAALMMIAQGESPERTWKRIKTEPGGELARHYNEAYLSATEQLHLRSRRN